MVAINHINDLKMNLHQKSNDEIMALIEEIEQNIRGLAEKLDATVLMTFEKEEGLCVERIAKRKGIGFNSALELILTSGASLVKNKKVSAIASLEPGVNAGAGSHFNHDPRGK
jgi:hypothetical protein